MEHTDYETAITEVDTRLRVANCFRQVLESDILSPSEDQATHLVASRLREFVNEELAILMGIKTRNAVNSVSPQTLTADDIGTIKQMVTLLTATLAKKESKKTEMEETSEPEVQHVETKAVTSKKKTSKKASKTEEFEKFKHLIPEKYKDDPTLTIENGRVSVYQRDAEGNIKYKENIETGEKKPMLKDVTLVIAPPSRLPMPGPGYYNYQASVAPTIQEGFANSINSAIRRTPAVTSPDNMFIGSPDFNAE